jgi:hypothetical protein
MSYRSNDYDCPEHGRFDTLVPRDEEDEPQPCPECGEPSPYVFPAPMGRMAMQGMTFVKGKSDGPRTHRDLDTRAMADGMTRSQFKKKRREMWAGERRAEIRKALS